MSSQTSQNARYLLTLVTGTILLPVIIWYFQSQSHVERLYLWKYLRQFHQSLSKGQYQCKRHIIPYTIIPSLITSVTVSRLSVIIRCLLCQSPTERQYLSESTFHLTPYIPTVKGEFSYLFFGSKVKIL